MLPFPDPQNILDKSTEQLELNPHLLPNSSYLIPSVPTIFFPDGFHDLDLSSDGITNAVPTPARPSLPLSDLVPQMVRNMSGCSSSRKRSKRKDRQQSKICTANGQRDPRMRLSIDVAKKFFRLQDMLGFDKASKTVQWLLTMSKAAIKDLTTISSSKICTSSSQSPKCDPSALVCEDSCSLSGSKNKSSTVSAIAREVKKNKAKKEAVKPSRKTEFHLALARESRAKARERARERTREKQRMTSLPSSITFDASKEEHNLKSLPDFAYEEEGKYCKPHQGLNIASDRAYECPMICGSALIPIFENSLGTTAINDACSIFQEQWDMEALSLYPTSLVAFNPNV